MLEIPKIRFIVIRVSIQRCFKKLNRISPECFFESVDRISSQKSPLPSPFSPSTKNGDSSFERESDVTNAFEKILRDIHWIRRNDS